MATGRHILGRPLASKDGRLTEWQESRSQRDEAQGAMFGTPLLRLSTLVELSCLGGSSIAATVFS
jgi:hypothetical protein